MGNGFLVWEIGLKTNKSNASSNGGEGQRGNRHARMNAVRMRKEAQVYSAEEKAWMLAALNKEERLAKEQSRRAMRAVGAAARNESKVLETMFAISYSLL